MSAWWKAFWLGIAAVVLQASFFSFLQVGGSGPNLVIAVIATYAFVVGRSAGLLGLAIGVAADMIFGRPIGLGGVSYAVTALIMMPLGRRLYQDRVFIVLLAVMVAVLLEGIVEIGYYHMVGVTSSHVWQHLMISTAYTLPFAPILWWIFVRRTPWLQSRIKP